MILCKGDARRPYCCVDFSIKEKITRPVQTP
jgi:hypothetical protein